MTSERVALRATGIKGNVVIEVWNKGEGRRGPYFYRFVANRRREYGPYRRHFDAVMAASHHVGVSGERAGWERAV